MGREGQLARIRNAYNFDGEARRKTATRRNRLQIGRLHYSGSSTRWEAVDWIYTAVRLELVAVSCEQGKELPGSLQCSECLALQSTLLKDSPPSSWWG